MERWYVAETHPQSEAKALAHLARQGYAAYLPRYLKSRRHARRTDTVKAPLFPGYLFVFMDVAKTRWRAIRSTIGIRHLICEGEKPLAVPPGVGVPLGQLRQPVPLGVQGRQRSVGFRPGWWGRRRRVRMGVGPRRQTVRGPDLRIEDPATFLDHSAEFVRDLRRTELRAWRRGDGRRLGTQRSGEKECRGQGQRSAGHRESPFVPPVAGAPWRIFGQYSS